jgi:Spy/CpxP family protein refolding chaperone
MFYRLLLTGLLVISVASAQRGGGRGGRGGGGGMEGGGFAMAAPSKFDTISETLKLTKDQKKALKTNFDESHKAAAPLRDQIAKARLAVGEAVQTGKGEEEIKKLASGLGALEAQMAEIELKAFAQIYAGLEKDQRAGMSGVFPMMKGMFSGKNWNSAD